MSFNQEAAERKISRLNKKVQILETMIEDHSREAYSEEIKRSIINSVLELSLKADNSFTFLQLLLDILMHTDILQIANKGAIYLLDKEKKYMVRQVQSGLTESEQARCEKIKLGHCLCGKAATSGQIIFSNHIDERHEITFPDMAPHGHYCVPIKTAFNVLGLISIHLPNKSKRNEDTIQFLTTFADIAAGTLERIRYANALTEYQKELEQKVVKQVREIEKEKEQLTVTLRSIGDGVITTDTDCRVTMLNPVAETLTGWNLEDSVGRPLDQIYRIFNKEADQKYLNPAEQILDSGARTDLSRLTTLITRNGKKLSITDSGAPIRDRNSKIIGVVLVFRDVTEQLLKEEHLLKSQKLESIGVLAGGIAHDFNNILAAILGNISLALLNTDKNEKNYQLLTNSEKAVVRAKDLTQQLLTFAKGGSPVIATVSIGDIITEAADFVLHGSNVTCYYSFPQDLWPVKIDKGQVGQVIQNIVINGIHAMPDGGIIDIHCENIPQTALNDPTLACRNYVKIMISDHGTGMEEETAIRIFDPFFTTKGSGSGLGLAISHSIIKKHNGNIAVNSALGKGTTFTIYLPATGQLSTVVEEVKQDISFGAGRVMVMDDEELLLQIAQDILDHLGYEVILVRDGIEAIEHYRATFGTDKQIDVIIMDLTIPDGMGGKKAVSKILNINPDAKVIVSSGYSNDPIMANCRQYGFTASISKPINLTELSLVLDTVFKEIEK